MNPLNFIRVKDRKLSLWQSAVEKYIRQSGHGKTAALSKREALAHPLSIATAHYVSQKHADKNFVPLAPPKDDGGHDAWVYKSHLGFLTGEALAGNDMEQAAYAAGQYRQFSDEDYSLGPPPTGFATCPVTYASYLASTGDTWTYNDWTVQGNNNINYGVIDWQLPNNAKVGIIGDWGTGLADAQSLLTDMMINHQPDAIIHLGDIYYSGTPDECQDYFANVVTTVFNNVLGNGNRIPVFSMAGNHDYYALGAPFFALINGLNNYEGIASAVQDASYFCLRTADNGWQFLAMDTGFNDSDPADQFNANYAGPGLQSTEIQWHQDKLQNFSGNTIMLSHHQVFSANATINGELSSMLSMPYFNTQLYSVVSQYIPGSIAAWIWGHEHNFVMYAPGISQLPAATLLGNSAYEELTSADPYTVNYPQIPYLLPLPAYEQYELGTNADSNGITYYNHGYGIIDLSVRENPTDPVQISYYQFPSWGDTPPANPASSLMYQQTLQPAPVTAVPIVSGQNYYLSNSDGMLIQPCYQGDLDYDYPVMLPGTFTGAVQLTVQDLNNNASNQVYDGDVLTLASTESVLDGSNLLTVDYSEELYYSDNNDSSVNWIIHKLDTSVDNIIRTGDLFYLESQDYSGNYLMPDYSEGNTPGTNFVYLTTGSTQQWWWRFNAPQ